jgi:hypothetical protein
VNDFLKKVRILSSRSLSGSTDFEQSEVLDAFDDTASSVVSPADSLADEQMGFRNAVFSWSKETDGASARSQQEFKLNIDGEVIFERGRINLVVGPTGSGAVIISFPR